MREPLEHLKTVPKRSLLVALAPMHQLEGDLAPELTIERAIDDAAAAIAESPAQIEALRARKRLPSPTHAQLCYLAQRGEHNLDPRCC